MEILILTVIILALIQLWVIGIFINSILIEVLEKEKSEKIQKNIQKGNLLIFKIVFVTVLILLLLWISQFV